MKNFVAPKGYSGIILVFFLESCVELGFTCSTCIIMINKDRFSTGWEVTGTIMMFGFTICLVIAPLLLLRAGCKYRTAIKKDDKDVIERYEPYFEDKRSDSGLAVHTGTLFFLRRYILMLLIVFAPEKRNVQIGVFIYLTLAWILIFVHAKPFKEPSLNKQELFNELTVLLSGYFLYAYTEFVGDEKTRY